MQVDSKFVDGTLSTGCKELASGAPDGTGAAAAAGIGTGVAASGGVAADASPGATTGSMATVKERRQRSTLCGMVAMVDEGVMHMTKALRKAG